MYGAINTNLCDQHLTCIIRINKTCAENVTLQYRQTRDNNIPCINPTINCLVTMAAFDSIASDMFGLIEKLINFQKPHWSHHYIPSSQNRSCFHFTENVNQWFVITFEFKMSGTGGTSKHRISRLGLPCLAGSIYAQLP